MDNKKALEAFGKCYNSKNFSDISVYLSKDISYDSFDCLYSIKSTEAVVNILNESILNSTDAYEGYYFWKTNVIRHLSNCILICDADTLKCKRIISIKIKKRKIVNIVGYNPVEYKYTRGKLIDS